MSQLSLAIFEKYVQKLIASLETPIQFIKADSEDESGTQTFFGITKIKLVKI